MLKEEGDQFKSHTVAEEVVSGSWRLCRKEDSKKIWMLRDLNEEEKTKTSELWKQAKEKTETQQRRRRQGFTGKLGT